MADHSFPPGLSWLGAEGAGPEAALLDEHWEAVLCYADLCTTSPAEAVRLAGEAFTRGIEGKRQGSRLPWLPVLLTAVRDTAGQWHTRGQSERLSPELRIWFNSERAAAQRPDSPDQLPRQQPLALRALVEMPEADAELLWAVEIEWQAAPGSAEKPGDKAREREAARVREAFRGCCLRVHANGLPDEECRRYTRLLDAATRSPDARTPEDLRRHLAGCVECSQAAVCLSLYGGGLPGAMATGVLGWGGLAYLERRRRAAVTAMGAAESTETPLRRPPAWASAVAALALITGLALIGVIVTADGPSAVESSSAQDVGASRGPTATELTPASRLSPVPSSPTDMAGAAVHQKITPTTKPSGSSSAAPRPKAPSAAGPAKRSRSSEPAYCTARYTVVQEWPDGFKAEVDMTSREPLNGWSIGWTYRDGQQVNQMWDGTYTQDGDEVTAIAADYDKTVSAGKPFGVGFLASWQGQNSPPRSFTLNGHRCQT